MSDSQKASAGVSSTGYLPWVEAARTLLMTGVVLVHVDYVAVAAGVPEWWPFKSWSCLPLGIMVPSFFLIAGFVLGRGDPEGAPFDARRFFRGKIVALLIPFLLWNAIMLGLHKVFRADDILSVGDLLRLLFSGYWHLYFVSALLQCFVLYVVLRRWMGGRGLAAVVIAAAVVSGGYYGLASWLFWTNVRQDGFFEIILNRTFMPWCFFFFLGIWVGRRPAVVARIIRFWWVFALCTLGAFQLFLYELERELALLMEAPLLQYLAGGFPFQVLGALAYFGFFGWLGRFASFDGLLRGIAGLAPLSLGVYLCHNAILLPLHAFWQAQDGGRSPLVAVPSLWLWTCALALVATALGGRLGLPGRILFMHRGARAKGAPKADPSAPQSV